MAEGLMAYCVPGHLDMLSSEYDIQSVSCLVEVVVFDSVLKVNALILILL